MGLRFFFAIACCLSFAISAAAQHQVQVFDDRIVTPHDVIPRFEADLVIEVGRAMVMGIPGPAQDRATRRRSGTPRLRPRTSGPITTTTLTRAPSSYTEPTRTTV